MPSGSAGGSIGRLSGLREIVTAKVQPFTGRYQALMEEEEEKEKIEEPPVPHGIQMSGKDLIENAKARVPQGTARRERRQQGKWLAAAYSAPPSMQCPCEDASCMDRQSLAALSTIEPSVLNGVFEGWEEIEFTVDSGASETVISEEMLQSVETKESSASRRG